MSEPAVDRVASASPESAVAGAPDWSTFTGEARCPLCDYNLYSLTEPRCPECGYRFEWADLTDPNRRVHPYLFEHHPRRNLWSLFKTWLGGHRPRRFWRSLKPSQPSRPGRLVLYWCLTTSLLLVGYVGLFAWAFKGRAAENARWRAEYAQSLAAGRFAFAGPRPTPEAVQAFVDEAYPPVGSAAFFSRVYRDAFRGDSRILAAVGFVVWPWLTFAVLMIFQASMRRARVRNIHALRAVLYSCDTGLWVGLAMVWLLPPAFWDYGLDLLTMTSRPPAELRWREVSPLFVTVAFLTYTWYRLGTAYQFYLQFHRPFATAAASQVIVLLTATVVTVYLLI